ncbi:MAG: hypothetical protein MJZ27_10105 [Bacteroidales bacterium]|nr:hypothetical protein [Bacteroidales bacterium]
MNKVLPLYQQLPSIDKDCTQPYISLLPPLALPTPSSASIHLDTLPLPIPSNY